MTRRSDVSRYAARLRDVRLSDFVAARNALVLEVKATDPASARVIKEWKKPSPAAWALNQLAHVEDPTLHAYLSTASTLQAVQTGKRAADLPQVIRAEREGRQAVVKRAVAVLADGAIKVTPVLRRQLADTLLAAATGDPAWRAALEAGSLVEDLRPGELDLLASLQAPPQRPRPHLRLVGANEKPEPREHARPAAKRASKQHAAAERKAAAADRQASRAAEKQAAMAARKAAAAEKQAAKAAEQAEAAARRAVRTEAIAVAKAALRDAQRAVAGARKVEARCREALSRALDRAMQ